MSDIPLAPDVPNSDTVNQDTQVQYWMAAIQRSLNTALSRLNAAATQWGVFYSDGTSILQATAAGPANSVLTGTGTAPAFSTTPSVVSLTATTTVTGLTGVFTGASVTIGTGSTTAGSIVLKNATNNNTSTIKGGVVGSNLVWTWPTADVSGALQSNGSGVLSFAAVTAKAVILAARSVDAAGTSIYFGSGCNSATEADVSIVVPYTGTLKNFYVRTGATFGGSGSACTLRKNAANTTLVTTATPNTTNTTYSDVTHTVSVTAGDLINISFGSAVGVGDQLASWSVELDG